MEYNKELDNIISAKMAKEVERILNPAYTELKKLGYIEEDTEGCVTARKMFGHIFGMMKEDGLYNFCFRETHISDDKLSSYGMKIVEKRKRKLLEQTFK